MAELAEFYLASLWAYKPKIVKQVIDSLAGLDLEHANFSWDDEYQWFKVTCLEHDAVQVRHEFALLARQIEEEAFENHEDSLLSDDDTLRSSFDTDWFSQGIECDSSLEVAIPEDLSRHEGLIHHPFTVVWDDLDTDNEPYSVHEIMTGPQFETLTEETGVQFSFRLGGKLVHIGGDSEEAVWKALEKLKVMLAVKKLSATLPMVQHLMYTEDYIEPGQDEFTVDIRYLANIDPELVSSTLLDRTMVSNLEEAYQMIYRVGASLRLCTWDPARAIRVSLLGPKVTVRRRDKSILGNRPTFSLITSGNRVSFTFEDFRSPNANPVSGVIDPIETWIESLPVTVDPVYTVSHAEDTDTSSEGQTDGSVDESDDEPREPLNRTAEEAATGDIAGSSPAIIEMSLLDRDVLTTATVNTELSNITQPQGIHEELAFTGDDSLIDMLAAVEIVGSSSALQYSINWSMPPLIPSCSNAGDVGEHDAELQEHSLGPSDPAQDEKLPTSGTNLQQDNKTSDNQDIDGFRTDPNQHFEGSLATETQSSATQRRSQSISGPQKMGGPDVHSIHPQNTHSRDNLVVTDGFVGDIEAAIASLLSTGPYRRGRFAVRAEFGRAILGPTDPSGVAFNDMKTPSNGWRKRELQINMAKGFGRNQNILFTNVLSTYASDIVDMVNITPNGSRLWNQRPSRAWTTYSFYCTLRSGEGQFIVDVKDNGTSSDVWPYSVRPNNHAPGAQQPLPVYVHAIRRHWDLKIAVSHVNTEDTEEAYGSFPNELLKTLRVLRDEKGNRLLWFGYHESFSAYVTEARVLTKWHYPSLDNCSVLEITEVERLGMESPYHDCPDGWTGHFARSWKGRWARLMRSCGELPRWYEAAILSQEVEQLCRQNAALRLGEKADWVPQDLKERGVLSTLYGPALQMVREMDHVGRNDDNNLSEKYGNLLLRPNDLPPHVPGSLPAQEQRRARQKQQHRRKSSGGGASETASIRSGTPSTRASSSTMAPPAPGGFDNNPHVKFW